MDWKDTELHKFVKVASVDDDVINLTINKNKSKDTQKSDLEKRDMKYLFQKIDLDSG
jgi:hypothetical protein